MADDPKAKATENAKKRVADGKEARDLQDVQRAAMAKGKPTPTQEECDIAVSGGWPELEEDGSGPEQHQTKQIEAGKPADSDRLLPMLERHIAFYGRAPRQAAADGGFATRVNLATAKARGVCDMAFHKKAGLRIEDMVRSKWVYRKLRNFRAGIEAGISCLKRAYGLARCTWRGLDHFKTYVWSSVVAYNLVLFARLKPI